MSARAPSAGQAVLAAASATLLGIGLARFAYTPLIPPLITEGWFTAADAAYLGAANLVGYLAGALAGRRLAALAAPATVMRALMLLTAATFFAGAHPLSFAWYSGWRFVSGFAGGAMMVLAAPSVLPLIPPARRGFASGVIFTGVGLGIAASGTLVPLLLRIGLTETWWALGALSLLLTALVWPAWPSERPPPEASDPGRAGRPRSGLPLNALYLEYALNAVGLVPHMVFLVDFIARGLGQGLSLGARYWVVFGLGAMAGPLLAGRGADAVGFRRMLRLAFVLQALAVGVVAVSEHAVALLVSSAVVGAFVPGVTTLTLGRARELTEGDEPRRRVAWGWCTAAFAVGQAAGAYALSAIYAAGAGYALLFVIGAAAIILALAVDLAAAALVHAKPRAAA